MADQGFLSRMANALMGAAETGAEAYGSASKPMAPQHAKMMASALADFTPVIGDIKSGIEGVQAAREGDWIGAGLGALGALPVVPNMAGMIKGPLGRIPETGAETRNLAEMLKRAGEKAGHVVSHEGSAISPSQYVTFSKAGNEAGGMTRQVRLSNHADKYPELASGVRTSVDPSTDVSFEQAVNWLGREGFPTSLSKRYENIPTWEQFYAARRSPKVEPQVLLDRLKWKWKNDPKFGGGTEPTMDTVFRDYADVIVK